MSKIGILNLQGCKTDYEFTNERYYISRNKSHLLPGNANDNFIKRRHVINEEEVINLVKKYNFKVINLEDYSFEEKIKIFNTSGFIISPQSGALTMCICANKQTKILELCTPNPHQFCDQYKEICKALNIYWERMLTQKIDKLDNMKVDCNILENKIKSLL